MRYRFDAMVLYFFLSVTLVFASSFIYRYWNVQECPDIIFDTSEQVVSAGEMVMFVNKTPGINGIEWDFGDNSKIKRDLNVNHIYAQPGEYLLKVTVNGNCSDFRRIMVTPKKSIVDKSLIPNFTHPNVIAINKRVRFTCLTGNATSYEWRFGETGKVDSREKNPTYKYATPGLKTVSLIINGNDKYIAKRMVHVMTPAVPKAPKKTIDKRERAEKEPAFIPESPNAWASYDSLRVQPKKEEKKLKHIMKDEELLTMMRSYSQNLASMSDFSSSFCEKLEDALVVSNGKVMKFPDFLESIKGVKLKIRDYRTIRGEEGCIMQVIIKYRISK